MTIAKTIKQRKPVDNDRSRLESDKRWVPKYFQIYEYLHRIIAQGKFEIRDKLPTEMELAEKFNVSRMTSKKALDKLVIEGMVVRKKGKGTFLTLREPQGFLYNLDITTGFFKDIRNYGLHPTSKTIEVKVLEPSDRISTLLELSEEDRVIYTLRVFYVDDEPIMIEKNFMSYAEFGGLLKEDLEGLRYPLLKEKFGVIPHHSNQTFSAVLASKKEKSIFKVSAPFPCIELEFLVFDEQNVPIEIGYYTYRGDRYRFNIDSIDYIIE